MDQEWIASETKSKHGSWRVFTKQGMYGTLDASAPGIGREGSKRNAILQAAAPELLKQRNEARVALTELLRLHDEQVFIFGREDEAQVAVVIADARRVLASV